VGGRFRLYLATSVVRVLSNNATAVFLVPSGSPCDALGDRARHHGGHVRASADFATRSAPGKPYVYGRGYDSATSSNRRATHASPVGRASIFIPIGPSGGRVW
jgi:hypothetical protein